MNWDGLLISIMNLQWDQYHWIALGWHRWHHFQINVFSRVELFPSHWGNKEILLHCPREWLINITRWDFSYFVDLCQFHKISTRQRYIYKHIYTYTYTSTIDNNINNNNNNNNDNNISRRQRYMAESEASRASELGGPGASTLSELIDQVDWNSFVYLLFVLKFFGLFVFLFVVWTSLAIV